MVKYPTNSIILFRKYNLSTALKCTSSPMELESEKVKKGQITNADLQHAEAIFGRVIDDQKKIG